MSANDVSLTRRVADLEQRLRIAEAELSRPRDLPPSGCAPRDRWLGRIAASPTPTTSDDTYAVELLSATYDDSAPGVTGTVIHERGTTVYAKSWPKRDYQAGAYVVVDRLRGSLSGDSYSGEWWIASDRAEVRWGRTTTYGYSYPDFSRSLAKLVSWPVYEVELGRLPHVSVATGTGEAFGHVALVSAADRRINPAFSAFSADSPQTIVEACSLIGDIHRGQPVLLVLEGGRWYIVGPDAAGYSRERLRWMVEGWRASDGLRQAYVTGADRLNLQLHSVVGTGGSAAYYPPYPFHDIRQLEQAGWYQPAFEVQRRGDYELSLFFEPAVYQYNYLTGSYLANEYATLTSTLTVTDSRGDTVACPTGVIWWRSWVTLEWVAGPLAPSSTTIARWPVIFQYAQPPVPIWGATRCVSLNKGDQLRLVLENDATEFYPPVLSARGFQSLSLELDVRRVADGMTWIP